MEFCFVYSSGGGAGDWNAIDRVWLNSMPTYFKNNLLIKFGDIFFNHRSSKNLLKTSYWNNTVDAKQWLIDNTKDQSIRNSNNIILDVGTSKIVSFITHHNANATGIEIIHEFDRLLKSYKILEKYCRIIMDSNIENAVTFDIPNLFKVRTQSGNVARNLFIEPGCRELLINASAEYANFTFHNTGSQVDKLLTIVSAQWSDFDIRRYFDLLDYTPSKIAIGGLTDYKIDEFGFMLNRLDKLINFGKLKKVHFLGSGGIKKSNSIIDTLGNLPNFSVDNTTAYNRAIDGNTQGTAESGYYDYVTKDLIRINRGSLGRILHLHSEVPNDRCLFSVDEMNEILEGVLMHQSGRSSHETYNCRAKLVIHNFDVFKHNVE